MVRENELNVSRETLDRLEAFHALVAKWNKSINLVSKSSIPDLWDRHIWDSAQLAQISTSGGVWVDIGSGGGFPGIVTAIFALETAPDRKTVLIESDIRKSAFLRTAIRELELNAKVLSERIELAHPQQADVMSARALADLTVLLGYADRHLIKGGTALFMKGATWQKEVEMALKSWSFELQSHKSKTNADAAILEIREIERA